MTSPSPLLYDTYYHIYNRGVNRENIFFEERNYEYFLKLYDKHITPVADTFGYSLLRNHFHLVVRVKAEEEISENRETLRVSSANGQHGGQSLRVSETLRDLHGKPLGSKYVSDQFSNFFNAYAKGINKAYNRSGSLFQHPFGRVPITTDRQFWNVISYIHQNPQKHGFVDDFRDWKYSSYGIILDGKPTLLKRKSVLDWFGGKEEYLRLHSDWVGDAQSKWFAKDDFD
jgi:REP element-mobilizing transposase RayT